MDVHSGQGVLSMSWRRFDVDHSPEMSLAFQGELVCLLGDGALVVPGLVLLSLCRVSQGHSAALGHLLGLLQVALGTEVALLTARVWDRHTHWLSVGAVDREVRVTWTPELAELALTLHPPVLLRTVLPQIQRD